MRIELIVLCLLPVSRSIKSENLLREHITDRVRRPEVLRPEVHQSEAEMAEVTSPEADCNESNDEVAMSGSLSKLLMPNYNKQLLPNKTGTEINIEIQINDIPLLSELDSFFELDLFFSELWREPRLAYDELDVGGCVHNLTLDLDYLRKLWTPNVCIVNSKSALIHSSPSENVFLILYRDGKLWKNCRMLVRGPCTIDLRLFPFDKQKCSLVFESYSFNSQKVRLGWFTEAPIRLAKTMELPDFILTQYYATHSLVNYPNGQWDQLKATFIFERRTGYFIMQVFLPTYMTVFAAWINFWMDPKELPTRATLVISAFLAMCLQLGNIQQNQPRVSYIKAMDVWMLGSITFLFGSLVELAIVSYIMRSDRNRSPANPTGSRGLLYNVDERHCCQYHPRSDLLCHKQQPLYLHHMTRSGSDGWVPRVYCDWGAHHNCNAGPKFDHYSKIDRSQSLVYKIDKFFLISYPPLYLIFNVVYWTRYG